MEAIEIYQKIIEITKDQDFQDVNTAIKFARDKIESAYYAKQQIGNAIECAQGLAAGNYPQSENIYAQKQHAEAINLVRSIVREELDTQKTDTKEAA